MMRGFLWAASLLLAASSSNADQRPFVWTYGSDIMGRGQTEVESYTTLSSPSWPEREQNLTATHQIELEVGMGHRFDFAVYQVIKQHAGDAAYWDGMKLRARYRLFEDDRWLSPVIYAESKHDASFDETEYEFKILLEKEWKGWTFAVNPILEVEEGESEVEITAGAAYKLGRFLNLGAEIRNSEYGTWIGPTISHGAPGIYTALGASWALDDPSDGKPSHEIRLIIGIELREARYEY
jgi:hypothetical protein